MSTKEVRALPVTLEVRQAGDNGSRTITGSILYNTESKVMRDIWGDAFVEELTAGCFDESLKTRNVVGLWSHDVSQVLGNTKAGTLRLESMRNGWPLNWTCRTHRQAVTLMRVSSGVMLTEYLSE